MGSIEDHLRARIGRAVRSILEEYRREGALALVNKARLAVAQLLAPLETVPRSARSRQSPPRANLEDASHDALAELCDGVALRDLNLVDSLLAQLEDLEANEDDPDALARLYQLDHLATQLRRNAENLRVLTGHEAGSAASVVPPLVDVLRAAMSSIEQYTRIEIGWVAALGVVDFVSDDVSRLLAELLDNATTYSPPTSPVTVSAHVTEQGSVLLRIEDSGIGLPANRLEVLNARLSAAPDSGSIEHMGLAVVRRLADKHSIHVRLEKRATDGTTVIVLLPANLVCEIPATPRFAEATSMTMPRAEPAPTPVPAQASPPRSPVSSSLGPSSEWIEQERMSPTPRMTRNGLIRRVPRSLRRFAVSDSTVLSPPDDPDSDLSERRERLMIDLNDFSEGEQAARRGVEPRLETEQKDHTNEH